MSLLRLLSKLAICVSMTKLLDQANMWSGASFMAGMAFLAIAIVIDRVWEAA